MRTASWRVLNAAYLGNCSRARCPACPTVTGARVPVHLSIVCLLRYFELEHLPPKRADVSKPFQDLAYELARTLTSPGN